MGKSKKIGAAVGLATCLSAMTLITACGGGSGGAEPQNLTDQPEITIGNGPDAFDPTDANEFVPSPGNGLDIAEDDPGLASNADYIEAQWLHMQTCLQVSAQEPTITVVTGKLTPTDSNDDVVRHIDGQIIASSHVTDSAASIQVRVEDFDGSLGKPGSYLRSITGRYLWLANNLPERDYPHECAKGE